MINRLAKSTANFINNNKKIQKVLEKVSDEPAKYSNRFSTVVTGFLRPVTNIATAPKHAKLDGIYNASSAISSSIVECVTGETILKPIKNNIDKSATTLQECGFLNSENSLKFKSINSRISKMFLIPINTIMKYTILVPITGGIKKTIDKFADVKNVHKKKLDING